MIFCLLFFPLGKQKIIIPPTPLPQMKIFKKKQFFSNLMLKLKEKPMDKASEHEETLLKEFKTKRNEIDGK